MGALMVLRWGTIVLSAVLALAFPVLVRRRYLRQPSSEIYTKHYWIRFTLGIECIFIAVIIGSISFLIAPGALSLTMATAAFGLAIVGGYVMATAILRPV